MCKNGESKTTQIMMATVPHVTSGSGLRKILADGFLLDWVYNSTINRSESKYFLYLISDGIKFSINVRPQNKQLDLEFVKFCERNLYGNGQHWRPLCSHSNNISQSTLQLSVFPSPTVEIVETIPANNPLWNVGLKTNNDPTKLDSKLR